jgi:hypothetical protein
MPTLLAVLPPRESFLLFPCERQKKNSSTLFSLAYHSIFGREYAMRREGICYAKGDTTRCSIEEVLVDIFPMA